MLISCSKEEQNVNKPIKISDESEITTENGRLVFASTDVFQNTLDQLNGIGDSNFANWEKPYDYHSLRSYFVDNNTEDTNYTDDLLNTLLNSDKIVQIDHWIFKIDILNSKVNVLDTKDIEFYDDLLNDKPNDAILIFSTDEEVLSYLKDNEMIKRTTDQTGIFCKDRYADRKKKDYMCNYGGTNGYRIDCKVVYQKAGIYFSLEGKGKNQVYVAGIWWEKQHSFWAFYNCSFNIRCGSSITYSDNCTVCSEWTHSCSRRLYSSCIALKHYDYKIYFVNYSANITTNSLEISD
jgi:hypothetical protein